MRLLLAIFTSLLIASSSLFSQSFSVFDIDASNFPTIKAKFLLRDAIGNPIKNLSATDIEIKENATVRPITDLTCPHNIPLPISSVLVFDMSGSMSSGPPRIESAKKAANAWINGLPLGQSECALVSFDDQSMILHDFTKDRTILKNSITQLQPDGGTNYNQALIDLPCGGLNIAKTGKNRRVLIFLTDGQPNFEPRTQEIINFAKQNQITIYAVTLDMLAPQCIKDMTKQTGGEYFENITTQQEAEMTYQKLQNLVLNSEPCEISWDSEVNCSANLLNTTCTVIPFAINTTINYRIPINKIAKLEFNPSIVAFENPVIGEKIEKKISVTAKNSNFNITNILGSNSAFDILPKNFTINNGQTKELSVFYTPVELAYSYSKFEFNTNICSQYFYAKGVKSGITPSTPTLKVTYPNGDESFEAGSDTVITWDGIANSDTVSIDYSIDKGKSWTKITNLGINFNYVWKNIPKPISKECLVRVTQSNKLSTFDATQLLTESNAGIHKIVWNPVNHNLATISAKNNPIIWDGDTGDKILTLIGHTDRINDISWSPDGTKIATASNDKTIIIWDAKTGAKINTLIGNNSSVLYLNWSPNFDVLASANYGGTGIVWDANTGVKYFTLSGHTQSLTGVCWNNNGTKIATASNDNTGIIWDATSGASICSLIGHTNGITDIKWSPDGSELATASNDKTAIIWDVTNGAMIYQLKGHLREITKIAWSPDGLQLASSSSDQTAIIWDATNGQNIYTLIKHTAPINDIIWNRDGSKLATASDDNNGIIWDSKTGKYLAKLSSHTNPINSIAWSSDGSKIATSSQDSTGIVWNALTYIKTNNLKLHTGAINSISWSPNGLQLATASSDKTVIIWDAKSGQNLQLLSSHTASVNGISWSPFADKLATCSSDSTAIIWNTDLGTKLYTLKGHKGRIYSISWSPNANKLATASSDSTAIIWDSDLGTNILTLREHKSRINNVVWSPLGNKLATASNDSTAIIWDSNTGSKLVHLIGHRHRINNLSWSSDGTKIVTAGSDSSAIIWNAENGSKISTLPYNSAAVRFVAWSSNGNLIALAGSDKALLIFDINSNRFIDTLLNMNAIANNISWNPFNNSMAVATDDFAVWIWSNTTDIIQQDQSDKVFKIVAPEIQATAIDMKECLVNSIKDSLVTNFIQNTGTYKCIIESIYFTGADKDAFSLVSGLPKYEVAAGANKATEFRFKPTEERVYNAEIVIITQADTLKVAITGVGVARKIEVLNNLIDFGVIKCGEFKQYTDTATIKNIGKGEIKITKISNAGPNNTDFEIVNYAPPYTLSIGKELKLSLKFTATSIGRTSGRLLFDYEGQLQPAEVQLYAQAVGGLVRIDDDSAFAGEKKKIRLRLMNNIAPIQSATALPFRARIKYNPTLLTMTDSRGIKSVDKEYEICDIKGTWDMANGNLLGEFDYVAGLGNSTYSYLLLDEFQWLDNSGQEINAEVDKIDGLFTSLGICKEGGTRLVNPNANIGIQGITPNPAKDKITITAKITEADTKIKLIDIAGKVIKDIDCAVDKTKVQDFTIDLTNIPAGMYFIEFKSPNFSQVEKVVVEK